MHYRLIGLSMAAMLAFAACGGGDGDKGLDFDAKVSYKTSAKYDLRDYVVPTANSINTYENLKYVNNDGKKRFKDDPDRSTYTEKYDLNGTKVTVRDGQDNIDEIFEIKPDRIQVLDEQGNVDSTLARFVDMGDYIYVNQENDTTNNIPTKIKSACRVVKHYESKEIGNNSYTDVLEVTCETHERGESKGSTVSLSYEGESVETFLFIKEKGMGMSEEVSCDTLTTTLNGQDQSQATCTKEVSTLISHNTL